MFQEITPCAQGSWPVAAPRHPLLARSRRARRRRDDDHNSHTLEWVGPGRGSTGRRSGDRAGLARTPGTVPDPLVSSLLLVASLLLLLAFPGMYARQAEAAGWLGLVGHVLLAVGNVFFLVYAAGPLFTPAITGGEESATAFFLGMALILGLVLTAVATLRAKVSPRWSGILLLLATGVAFLFRGMVAEELPPIAGARSRTLVGVSLAVALSWIGGASREVQAKGRGDRLLFGEATCPRCLRRQTGRTYLSSIGPPTGAGTAVGASLRVPVTKFVPSWERA